MKWTLEKRKLDEIHEYAKNARYLKKIDAAQLHESINKFGQCEPLVINIDGTLIGGHQRLRTMKKMGYKEIDVYVPDIELNEKEVEELNIRLNKNTGDWDHDMLANAWDPGDLVDWGFSMEELHLEQLPDKEINEDGQEPVNKSCTMNIRFLDVGHLQEAENRISVIIDEYEGATYKVKVK